VFTAFCEFYIELYKHRDDLSKNLYLFSEISMTSMGLHKMYVYLCTSVLYVVLAILKLYNHFSVVPSTVYNLTYPGQKVMCWVGYLVWLWS